MNKFATSRIKTFLIAAAGKISLGIATPATYHVIELAVAEIARREELNKNRDACDRYDVKEIKALAKKVVAMIA